MSRPTTTDSQPSAQHLVDRSPARAFHNVDSQATYQIPDDQKHTVHSDDSTPSLRQRPTTATSKHSHFRAALGLHKTAPIDEEHDAAPHHENLWPRIRLVLRESFAEFWGVFIMIMFGNGSVAQVLLSEKESTAPGMMGFGGINLSR